MIWLALYALAGVVFFLVASLIEHEPGPSPWANWGTEEWVIGVGLSFLWPLTLMAIAWVYLKTPKGIERLAIALSLAGALALAQNAPARAQGPLYAGGQAPKASGALIVAFDGFAVGYVKAWGEPAWSAQHETAASVAAGAKVKRNGSFHACDLPDGSRSAPPAVYARSGYDLGHQTEAASQADKPPTFGTCNMSPQRPNLNRTIWAGIEAAVRDLATRDGELYVVTGPVIPQDPERLGGVVDVPSHSWKAVYDPKTGAAAYICQNTDAPVCSTESVAALAKQIGFDPFPAVAAGVKASAITLPQPTKGGALAH